VADKEQWQKLWKEFQEVVGFTFDNEGVIQSLKNQQKHSVMKEKLEDQIHDIESLIHHHKDDLKEKMEKAKKLAKELKLDVTNDLKELNDAVESLDLKQMDKKIKQLKKKS
jgi:hypothetical protein